MAAKETKVRIRCLSVPKGVESQASYGNESFTIDSDGIAEVSPDLARHILNEQPHQWEAVDWAGKLSTGQSVTFKPVGKKELAEADPATNLEATDAPSRGRNS